MVSISFSLFITTLLICMLVLLFAASRLRNSWQENPLTARQLWWRETFCTPRFWTGFLRRRNQSRLSSNPIGWLQQYSWSARLSKWGWCAVMIAIVSWFVAKDFRTLSSGSVWLKNALLVSMAFSAVGSFQREKQNGALELLLVTPLREKQIILGRLWGIWGQFLPAFGILLISAISAPDYVTYGSNFGRTRYGLNVFAAIRDFAVVPLVGLYFAMRLKNFMVAWLMTCALTLFLPSFVLMIGMRTLYRVGFYSSIEMSGVIGSLQTLLMMFFGIAAVSLLYSELKKRSFVLGKS